MSAFNNVLIASVTIDGTPITRPTSQDPYEWTEVPTHFATVAGVGRNTTYTTGANGGSFTIRCKQTDTAHSELHALARLLKQRPDPRFTLVHNLADIGQAMTGLLCSFAGPPPPKSSVEPMDMEWVINCELVVDGAPDPAKYLAGGIP